LDKAWLERVEGADMRRAGPTWAAGQDWVIGNADPNHGSDKDELHLFRSRVRPLLRADMDRDRDPIPSQRIPRFHAMQSAVPASESGPKASTLTFQHAHGQWRAGRIIPSRFSDSSDGQRGPVGPPGPTAPACSRSESARPCPTSRPGRRHHGLSRLAQPGRLLRKRSALDQAGRFVAHSDGPGPIQD
jgi:hypothetical protein